jgi:hypothetical protein
MQPEPVASFRAIVRASGSDQSLHFMPVVTRGSEGSCETGVTRPLRVIHGLQRTARK